jgi:hypothetical protein
MSEPHPVICRITGVAAERRRPARNIGITRGGRSPNAAGGYVADESATIRRVNCDRDLGQIPAGDKWCPHCNGYGSSLKDGNERCARCNGTGLVAADRAREAASAPTNGKADQ